MKVSMPLVDEPHFHARRRDRGDFAGDDRVLAQVAGVAGLADRILAELLDAERDALLLDVDVEHLRLDHVALVVLLDGLLARTVPVEVGEVDHAVDVAFEADEQAELGVVLDLALDWPSRPDGCAAKASHGFSSVCLRPSEMRRLAGSTSSTTTSTSCVVDRILPGCTFFLVHDISETWMRPSMPGSSSTNAP